MKHEGYDLTADPYYDFKDYKNNITKYISSQNNLNNIEISPHAYNVRNFIFHNYSNGKPLTEKTFKKNCRCSPKKIKILFKIL